MKFDQNKNSWIRSIS